MTTKTAQTHLTSNASKTDEIEFFAACAAAVEPGTYLADFFTPNLIGWVNEQIKSDIMPDLWGTMQYNDQQATKRLAEAQNAAVISEHLAQRQNAEFEQKTKTLEAIRDFSKNSAEGWQDNYKGLSADFNKVAEEREALLTEKSALEQKVLELKAKIYDLTISK